MQIEEGSQNSEQLREEDNLEIGIEGDDLGIEDIDLPEGNDLEDNCEQLFDIEHHVLENNRADATVEGCFRMVSPKGRIIHHLLWG